MSNRIVVVGAGGFGREVIAWLRTSPRWLAQQNVGEIVAIDDALPAVPLPAPVISTVTEYRPEEFDLGVCAIGDPEARLRVVNDLEDRGLRFPAFVHDSVIIGDQVSIGRGAVICPATVVTSNVTIGAHVHVNLTCTIGHDVTIDEFATISPSCNLNGGVQVGSLAFLGTATTVIPARRIGSRSLVGAGSVVIRDVADAVKVFGNPATHVKGTG